MTLKGIGIKYGSPVSGIHFFHVIIHLSFLLRVIREGRSVSITGDAFLLILTHAHVFPYPFVWAFSGTCFCWILYPNAWWYPHHGSYSGSGISVWYALCCIGYRMRFYCLLPYCITSHTYTITIVLTKQMKITASNICMTVTSERWKGDFLYKQVG